MHSPDNIPANIVNPQQPCTQLVIERIHFLSSRFIVYLEHYFYQLVS